MSKKSRPWRNGASGADMLALHAKRPAFLLAQTKTGHKGPSKADLLNKSSLDPLPQFPTYHETVAAKQQLSQDIAAPMVKAPPSEGEVSVEATVRVSLNRTNLSVVADKAIADKMPRCIPETIFKEGKIHGFRLTASSKGYLWSDYSVDGLRRITVSSSRYPMLGIGRSTVKFAMVEAASVEEEGDSIVVILPEERPEVRHIHKRRSSTRKRSEDHAAPGQPFPKAAPTRREEPVTTEVPYIEIPGTPVDEFTLARIRESVQYLQRAQSSPQWSGLKFSTDEMGVLHAEIHWSI